MRQYYSAEKCNHPIKYTNSKILLSSGLQFLSLSYDGLYIFLCVLYHGAEDNQRRRNHRSQYAFLYRSQFQRRLYTSSLAWVISQYGGVSSLTVAAKIVLIVDIRE